MTESPGVYTRTDVTYWVIESGPYGAFQHLISDGLDAAIAYRDKFMPKGRVERHTSVTTSVEEIVSHARQEAQS